MSGHEEFLPLHQAARRSGMTEVALRRRIRRGDLVAFADPRDLRVKLVRTADLDAYFGARPPLSSDGKEQGMSADAR